MDGQHLSDNWILIRNREVQVHHEGHSSHSHLCSISQGCDSEALTSIFQSLKTHVLGLSHTI